MSRSEENSLGFKSPTTVINYLREIGDDDAADTLAPPGGTGQGFSLEWGKEVWGRTGALIGYIPDSSNDRLSPIENAFTVRPDQTLRGSRVKITLDSFWVQRFPGRGTHKILCEFTGKNQIEGKQEELKFAVNTEANDNSNAAITGAPIFLGVTVGNNGIEFEGITINVASKTDDDLLAALNSGPFQDGLGLLTTAQPALKPFVGLTTSVVNAVLKRSKNRQIYKFKLGLDFSTNQTAVALRYGSFVVVQGSEPDWDWEKLGWNAHSQQIIDKGTDTPITYNYLVFRVSDYHD